MGELTLWNPGVPRALIGLLCALGIGGCIDQRASMPEPAPDEGAFDAALGDGMASDARPASDTIPDAMSHARADAMPDAIPDAMPDAIGDGIPDAQVAEWDAESDGEVDPSVDAGPVDPGPSHFVEFGQCFEHTPRCERAADCPAGFGACVEGRCRDPDRLCECASDGDCGDGAICVSNEQVCGQCTPPQASCVDQRCPPRDDCVDGFCRDDCPGLDDGPPLRCRGEPPPGDCVGAWAYLREAGTCVPVDGVRCGPEDNAFADRADCLTRCRGPVACVATVERRTEAGATRRVQCPITHGPGACVALAHCVCELDLPPVATRVELRQCAFSLTVPRGALTFADFCGHDTLEAVVDRMAAVGVLGPDARVELTPGCATVLTDRSVGPTCTDGVRNGWESGIDCGPVGCPACP